MTLFILYIALAYFIGSIPTAIWYGRIFHKTDIRTHGSGNAGATNTIRTFGKKAGIIVLLIDISKGSVGVLLPAIAHLVSPSAIPKVEIDGLSYPSLAFGLAAALGHIYPIYEKFKGGKGVATLFGVILALSPMVALCAVISFIVLFMFTQRVSIGSIISSIVFAIAFIMLQQPLMLADYFLVCIYPLLLMYTHRSNIERILNGTEPKLSLGKK